jgi:hypothetical protein
MASAIGPSLFRWKQLKEHRSAKFLLELCFHFFPQVIIISEVQYKSMAFLFLHYWYKGLKYEKNGNAFNCSQLYNGYRACHWTQGSQVQTQPRTMDF